MAQVDASTSSAKFSIRKISKLTEAWSPQITLYGIPWRISVRKCQSGTEKTLGFYLHCAIDECTLSPNWTATACATIKLLRVSGRRYVDGIEGFLRPFVFDYFIREFGRNELMQWDDLLNPSNQYVKNDRIKLKVTVTAEDPHVMYRSFSTIRCIDQRCECGFQAIYEINVTNITKLMAVRSSGIVMRTRPYDIQVFKNGKDFGVCLRQHPCSGYATSHCVNMTIELMSTSPNGNLIRRTKSAAEMDIISWRDMLDPTNGYVKNNSITLKIDISVNDMIGHIANGEPNVRRFGCSVCLNSSDPLANDAAERSPLKCPICLENIDNQNLTTTPCGHLFCTPCISTAVFTRGACSVCQTGMHLQDLRRIRSTA